MPYGLSIAASFLADEHFPEPIDLDVDMQGKQFVIDKAYNKGGELIDRELRSLIVDMYEMFSKHELTLDDVVRK